MRFSKTPTIAGLLALGIMGNIDRAMITAAEPLPNSELPAGVGSGGMDSLLAPPSLEQPLTEDDFSRLAEPANDASPSAPASVAAPARDAQVPIDRARQAYLEDYSVNNPLTRTALQNFRSSGDRFFDGFGGIPQPANSPLIPRGHSADYLLRLGPVKISPAYGPAVIYNWNFGSRTQPRQSANLPLGTSNSVAPGLSHGANASGDYGTITAGLRAEIGEPETGRFVLVDYGAAFLFGSGASGQNNPGQTLTLLGQYDFTRLKLGLGVTFDSLSGHSREFGGDIQRQLATLAFTGSYQWTAKTSFELDLSVPIAQYNGGIDSSGLTSTALVNYAYSTKTTFGLGFTEGITDVRSSASQTFEQINARMTSTASPFVSYNCNVSYEWRDTGEVHSTTPIFGIGVTWTPRVGTGVTLSLDRQVQTSAAIFGANFTSTSVTLSCTQRVGNMATLGASIGYERASYESTLSDQAINRLDQTVFAQASVTRTIFRHVALSATVSYFHTSSNDLPQESTQVTVSASYAF